MCMSGGLYWISAWICLRICICKQRPAPSIDFFRCPLCILAIEPCCSSEGMPGLPSGAYNAQETLQPLRFMYRAQVSTTLLNLPKRD